MRRIQLSKDFENDLDRFEQNASETILFILNERLKKKKMGLNERYSKGHIHYLITSLMVKVG